MRCGLIAFFDCEIAIDYEEHSCASFTFFEVNRQELYWTVNSELVNQSWIGIGFDPSAPGTYEICSGYQIPDCPQGVVVCEAIVVSEDCFEIMNIDNLNKPAFYVIPTLTTNIFRIKDLTGKHLIKIINQNGSLVFERVITNTNNQCDISQYPSGLYYILILNNQDKIIGAEKVLKF